MIYVREANFDDIEAEWNLVRSIPTSENGYLNPYYNIKRADFDRALYSMSENAAGIDLPEGFVPETTLFIWKDLQIVGQAKVRHFLTDTLRNGSGHIGYWISPEYRGKGIGTAALREVLRYAEDIIPEEEFCLRANADNAASLRVMEKNGGFRVGGDSRYVLVRIKKSGLPFLPMVRPMRESEYPLLKEFLYDAIYIPEGVEPPEKSIVERPELRVYTDGFGSGSADICLAAEIKGRIVGAVWSRIMNDYGHIDDKTPSLAISVRTEQRHRGIGTELMRDIVALLGEKGYPMISLAVQKANSPAVGLYLKTGFEIFGENDEEYLMICRTSKEGE